MRVTRNQITGGIAGYIKDEILPKMAGDKAMQIIASVAVSSALNNDRLLDSVFDNEMVMALLDDDGTGTYDISGLMASVHDAVGQYGGFPMSIPSIPFISPNEMSLRITAEDIEAMRRRIEG